MTFEGGRPHRRERQPVPPNIPTERRHETPRPEVPPPQPRPVEQHTPQEQHRPPASQREVPRAPHQPHHRPERHHDEHAHSHANHGSGGHGDHGHGPHQSILSKAFGMTIASGLFVAGTLFKVSYEIGKQMYVEGEKKLSHFWSVLVKSLKHPMGGASSGKSAPAADHGHGHGGGHH